MELVYRLVGTAAREDHLPRDHRDAFRCRVDDGFIVSSGADTGALWGCFLEVIVGLAGIGTAVTLFPVVKRQNEGMALGFVATRTLEAAMIFAVPCVIPVIGLIGAPVQLTDDLPMGSSTGDRCVWPSVVEAVGRTSEGVPLCVWILVPALSRGV